MSDLRGWISLCSIALVVQALLYSKREVTQCIDGKLSALEVRAARGRTLEPFGEYRLQRGPIDFGSRVAFVRHTIRPGEGRNFLEAAQIRQFHAHFRQRPIVAISKPPQYSIVSLMAVAANERICAQTRS